MIENILKDITAHILTDIFVGRIEKESRHLITKGMEIAGVELDVEDPANEEAIKDFIQNNGKVEFYNLTNTDKMESMLFMIEKETDKFILGRRVKLDVENMKIGSGDIKIKDGMDPESFGRVIKKMKDAEKMV
jgi:hypothetical protein